jgi:site-specific DNA recombinase
LKKEQGDWASLGRVSTEEQYEEGESWEVQKKLNLEFIKKNKGKLYKEYLEDGVSAFKKRIDQRPVMLELLNDVIEGKVKNIVAFKRDRIIRDPEDYYYLRKIFDKAGVNVYFTCPGEMPWGYGTPMEELMNGLAPLLSKFESMTISQRVSAVTLEAVKNGEWRCGRPPYGYIYNKQTKRVEKVPEQAEVCRMIRDMYVKGLGAGKISDILNNELRIPYVSPAQWNKSTLKKPRNYWYEGVVTSIVSKPVYMGIQEWDGKWYDCPAIDPIFTREEWEEAYNIYQSKRTRKIPHKYYSTVFLFKNILFCQHCGERMIPTYKTARYILQDGKDSVYEYYHYKCEGRWEKHNGCKQVKHNRNHIEPAIISLVSNDINGMDIDELYARVLNQLRNEYKQYISNVAHYENRKNEITEKIRQNTDAYMSAKSQAMRDQLEERAIELGKEREEIEKMLDSLLSNPPKEDISKNEVLMAYRNMQQWEGLMNSPDSVINRQIKHKLALSIIDRIYVDSRGNLSIEYKVGNNYPNFETKSQAL